MPSATVGAPTTPASALDPARREALIADFHRDGFALLPGVLADRAAELRARIDELFAEHAPGGSSHRYDDIVLARLFELDPRFQDLLTAEPFIGVAEAILGDRCHLVANNVVRNPPGRAIDIFHVDDELHAPLPASLPRHDARMTVPVNVLTFQILLSDVPDPAHGPTEFVPGSHYSGRHPDDPSAPIWEGRGPVAILGRAGDAYVQNGQCWHRGAPNRSERTRYLLQIAYGRRWVAQRLWPFVDYRLPDHVVARADARMLRVLGRHPKGAYG